MRAVAGERQVHVFEMLVGAVRLPVAIAPGVLRLLEAHHPMHALPHSFHHIWLAGIDLAEVASRAVAAEPVHDARAEQPKTEVLPTVDHVDHRQAWKDPADRRRIDICPAGRETLTATLVPVGDQLPNFRRLGAVAILVVARRQPIWAAVILL